MVTKEQIERINELARKKKSVGLSESELTEQKELRQLYIDSVKSNFKSQLDSIRVVDEKGNKKTLKGQDVSMIIPSLKPESEYTEEEKQHVDDLSQKLAAEFNNENQSVTEMGNPKKPVGEAGKLMVQRMNESHGPLTKWALNYLNLQGTERVLDIGCGGGAALMRLSKLLPKGKLFGIDYSDVSVEEASALNDDDLKSGKMEIILGSVSEMPYDNDTFDAIISVESYFFWPDLANDLKEVLRVLKTGGKVLLIAEIYQNDNLKEEQLNNIKKYDMNNLTIKEFETLFENVGFSSTNIHLKDGEDWIAVEGIK